MNPVGLVVLNVIGVAMLKRRKRARPPVRGIYAASP